MNIAFLYGHLTTLYFCHGPPEMRIYCPAILCENGLSHDYLTLPTLFSRQISNGLPFLFVGHRIINGTLDSHFSQAATTA